MIWIHTYGVGKFGKTIHKAVHDTEEAAMKQHAVLGGSVQCFMPLEEVVHMGQVLESEVSEIIDDFSSCDPGFAGSLEPGSSEWDCRKVKAMNMVKQILDGDY